MSQARLGAWGRDDVPGGRNSDGRPAGRQSAGGRRALVVAAFGAVYVIWGSTYLAIKYAVETLPPFLMGGVRFLAAGAFLYGWARLRGAAPGRLWRSALIAGALFFLGGNGGVVWSEQRLASGTAALLVATEPLWVVLLNWARPGGTRPRAGVFAGLAVGFTGVWLLMTADHGASAGGSDLAAALVVVGASFSWAAGSLYAARAPSPASPLAASGAQMLAGGLLLVAAGTAAGEWGRLDAGRVSAGSLAALAYLIVFGSVVAFTAFGWLLRVTTPARVATYAYVNPAVAVFVGWALAGEPVSGRTLLAAGVIIASVFMITSGEGRRGAGRKPGE